MESLSLTPTSIGGWPVARTSQVFRRDDDHVSPSFIGTGPTYFRVGADSGIAPVVPVVLGSPTEGVADFLDLSCDTDGPSRESFRSLIGDYRDKSGDAVPGQA
jgi:hypothetical protein